MSYRWQSTGWQSTGGENVRVVMKLEEDPLSSSVPNRSCWRPLLPRMNLGRSAIPERDFGEGLELSFDLMLRLLGACKAWYNGTTICIRGRWSMLVLEDVKENTDRENPSALQWHLHCDDDLDEGRPSITTENMSTSSPSPTSENLSESLRDMDLGEPKDKNLLETSMLKKKLGNIEDLSWMPSCRHFVGYCSEAKVVLGTSDATYDMRYTTLQVAKGISAALKSLTFGAGYQGFINVEGEVDITPHKSVLPAAPPKAYGQMILRSKKRVVLVYDILSQRACLVPFVNLLLHMAVIAAKKDDLDFPATSPSTLNASTTAAEFLLRNRKHVLAPTEDILEALVTRLFITATACVEQRRVERDMRRPWKTGVLYGWELMDVIEDKDEIYRKEVVFKNEHSTLFSKNPHPTWLPLCSDIGVFVCSGLGDVFQPHDPNAICDTWKTRLAQEKFLLLASTACVKSLAEGKGSYGPPIQLAQEAYWRPIGDRAAVFEPCVHGAARCVKHIQQIDKAKPSIVTPIPLPEYGAIVFGTG